MKKLYVMILMALMTINVFADGNNNNALQQVMKVIEDKQWIIIPESAEVANSIHYDGLQADRNYFSMDGDQMKVSIDYTNARRSGFVGLHKAETIVEDIIASGNDPITMPSTYSATYKIIKQEVTADKKGRNVIVRFSYLVEDSNIPNIGGNPMLEIRIHVKDMKASVRLESIRVGELYNGTLMAVEK